MTGIGRAQFAPAGIFEQYDMTESKRTKQLCAAFFILGVSLSVLLWAPVRELAGFYLHKPRPVQPMARIAGVRVPPCGRLVAIEIPLANTDGAFPDRAQRLASPKWFFDNMSASRLTEFLSSCDLRPAEKSMFLDTRNWDIRPNGVVVTPPEELIWSLTPQGREQIYSVLAKSPQNFPQCFPFRFPLTGFDGKFRHSDLPIVDVQKIKRLTYTNAGYLCFTDLEAVKGVLTGEEFKDLIETLYQLPSYMLRLRLRPDSDIDGLIRYWGKGGRERIISPLINSVAKVPGGASINISYLLPPFARLRLYTYPYTWNESNASKQDCFFTSMNFFNSPPNTNYFDRAYTTRALMTDYVQINRDPEFGDVVAVSDGNGDIIHVCVYIADDFVFTKNGVDPEQPWVLMKMPDMLMLYYTSNLSGHFSFLRRKDMT